MWRKKERKEEGKHNIIKKIILFPFKYEDKTTGAGTKGWTSGS